MTVRDITDKAPNPKLVKYLEDTLLQAKNGEIRSLVAMQMWDDNQTTHSWVIDARNDPRFLLQEFVLLQHDFVVNIEMLEKKSILYSNMFEK